jgi:hypothetical protein
MDRGTEDSARNGILSGRQTANRLAIRADTGGCRIALHTRPLKVAVLKQNLSERLLSSGALGWSGAKRQ